MFHAAAQGFDFGVVRLESAAQKLKTGDLERVLFWNAVRWKAVEKAMCACYLDCGGNITAETFVCRANRSFQLSAVASERADPSSRNALSP
jgi:hypothetical protein